MPRGELGLHVSAASSNQFYDSRLLWKHWCKDLTGPERRLTRNPDLEIYLRREAQEDGFCCCGTIWGGLVNPGILVQTTWYCVGGSALMAPASSLKDPWLLKPTVGPALLGVLSPRYCQWQWVVTWEVPSRQDLQTSSALHLARTLGGQKSREFVSGKLFDWTFSSTLFHPLYFLQQHPPPGRTFCRQAAANPSPSSPSLTPIECRHSLSHCIRKPKSFCLTDC